MLAPFAFATGSPDCQPSDASPGSPGSTEDASEEADTTEPHHDLSTSKGGGDYVAPPGTSKGKGDQPALACCMVPHA
jgi:hypothetical protein